MKNTTRGEILAKNSCCRNKASIENNCREFGDTTTKQKQYVSYEESTSSGEEKEEE